MKAFVQKHRAARCVNGGVSLAQASHKCPAEIRANGDDSRRNLQLLDDSLSKNADQQVTGSAQLVGSRGV